MVFRLLLYEMQPETKRSLKMVFQAVFFIDFPNKET